MIEFDDKTHTYTHEGKIIPSVSQILRKVLYGDKFKFVSDEVLEKASEFGTSVHRALETGFTYLLTEEEEIVYNNIVKLKEENFFVDIAKEKQIFSDLGYAGTLDLYALVMGEFAICDYKTTSVFDKEYVSWQLSFYALAMERMGYQVSKLYGIHAPKKGKTKLIEVPRKTQSEIEWLINKYKEME